MQYSYVLNLVLGSMYTVEYTTCSPVVTEPLLTSLCELSSMYLQFTKNTLSQSVGWGYFSALSIKIPFTRIVPLHYLLAKKNCRKNTKAWPLAACYPVIHTKLLTWVFLIQNVETLRKSGTPYVRGACASCTLHMEVGVLQNQTTSPFPVCAPCGHHCVDRLHPQQASSVALLHGSKSCTCVRSCVCNTTTTFGNDPCVEYVCQLRWQYAHADVCNSNLFDDSKT